MNLPGGPELIFILVVLLFLFGARKLPELARSMGQASKEFRQGLKDGARSEAVVGPCPYCGVQVEEDAKFCSSCGKPAEEIVAERARQSRKSA
jgi:TatA/E family protein of Tat protein translocase